MEYPTKGYDCDDGKVRTMTEQSSLRYMVKVKSKRNGCGVLRLQLSQ